MIILVVFFCNYITVSQFVIFMIKYHMDKELFDMKRHEEREKAMIVVYQHLLTGCDLVESMEDIFKMSKDEISDFAKLLINNSIANKDRYEEYINEVLEGWTFNRLGYIEQAILLIGCTEFDNKTAQMPVIIDEAVIMAKKYCDIEAYKLINGVLEKL